jgi:hypothetical protein
MNKLLIELEKLYQFLHGAYFASNDDSASGAFDKACHKLQEIINEAKHDNQ